MGFNPFMPELLATCSKDATIKLWEIPPTGLTESAKEPLTTLSSKSHTGLLGMEWHHTVNNTLATFGNDLTVRVWDVGQ
jgi:coronin-2